MTILDINYDNYVVPYENRFVKIKIPDYKIQKINALVKDIVAEKTKENIHAMDCNNEYRRFYTGLTGEAAIEELFHIDIIDWSVGNSNTYNVPDVPGYNVGIKTVEYNKFPIIFKTNSYPQIINLKISYDTVMICGLATTHCLNKYQSDDLILSQALRRRGTKTGFYGFGNLVSFKNVNINILKGNKNG